MLAARCGVGAEVSSNSANFFSAGLKGRAYEDKYEDHLATEGSYKMDRMVAGKLSSEEVPLRNAMNEVLRDEYLADNQKGIDYWNRECEKANIKFRFKLPSRRFHRALQRRFRLVPHRVRAHAIVRPVGEFDAHIVEAKVAIDG